MELVREVMYNCRNRNANRLIDFKAEALSPRRTRSTIISRTGGTTRKMIVEEDPENKMDDGMKQTILLKILPQQYVNDLREQRAQGNRARTTASVLSRHHSTRSIRDG